MSDLPPLPPPDYEKPNFNLISDKEMSVISVINGNLLEILQMHREGKSLEEIKSKFDYTYAFSDDKLNLTFGIKDNQDVQAFKDELNRLSATEPVHFENTIYTHLSLESFDSII